MHDRGTDRQIRFCTHYRFPIRFENRFEDEIEKVDEALAAIAQLYALSEKIAEIDLREKHEQSKPT